MLAKKRNKNQMQSLDALEWWFDYPCEHRNSVCAFYEYNMTILCQDCQRQMNIKWNPDDHRFYTQTGPNGTERGTLNNIKVAEFLDTSIQVIFIPDPPGDPKGKHPEKDALRIFELMTVIKQNGFDVLSRATKVNSTGSATTCSCCGHDEAGS